MFAGWALAAVLSTGLLMEKHLTAIEPRASLTAPKIDASEEATWTITHILSAGCPCSDRTLEGIVKHPSQPATTEQFFISGESKDWEARFAQTGRMLTALSPEELEAKFQISGGPYLIIQDPQGSIRYRGGYGARPYLRPDEIKDRELIAQLQAGKSPTLYPAIGCQFD